MPSGLAKFSSILQITMSSSSASSSLANGSRTIFIWICRVTVVDFATANPTPARTVKVVVLIEAKFPTDLVTSTFITSLQMSTGANCLTAGLGAD